MCVQVREGSVRFLVLPEEPGPNSAIPPVGRTIPDKHKLGLMSCPMVMASYLAVNTNVP